MYKYKQKWFKYTLPLNYAGVRSIVFNRASNESTTDITGKFQLHEKKRTLGHKLSWKYILHSEYVVTSRM